MRANNNYRRVYYDSSYNPNVTSVKSKYKKKDDEYTVKQFVGDTITGAAIALAIVNTTLAASNKMLINYNDKAENPQTAIVQQQAETDYDTDIQNIINEAIDNQSQVDSVDVSAEKAKAKEAGNYYVAAGETLWGISSKFQTSVDNFAAYTDISPDNLLAGQIIENVPIIEADADTTLNDVALKNNIADIDAFATLNEMSPDSPVSKGEKLYSFVPQVIENIPPTPVEVPEGSARLEDGTILSTDYMYDVAISVAPNGAERPHPIVDSDGNIVAEVKIFEPTKKGELSGKTILVNSGHGGYNPNNGLFDPGTKGVDENGNDVEEWYMNKLLAGQIKDDLLAKGAKVIYTSGSVYTVTDEISKYSDSVDATLSVHLNYADDASAQGYQIYTNTTEPDENNELANNIVNNIDPNASPSVREGNYAVLRASNNNPSVLIEAGFMSNKTDLANILNQTDRTQKAIEIVDGLLDSLRG
ncbi:MAG: N-acetylmuramoyl-L-alanine amidase [Candidatus Gastranaerophilales bacterium]|nr:N-acetylmuramoyl-L-alanine amidase [Candidatus Gastranaerophilales bacterium]